MKKRFGADVRGEMRMSIKLKDLISHVNSGDIKLVAGKRGYSNPVEWVHMVGNTEIAGFLTGGEIAFTTGVGIREDMTLLMLVKSVYERHASAMVINVGPYIPEIPEEVIAFGDSHNFPVFEVPWRVHMADMMRVFCFEIQRSEQREMELSAAFRYAVFTPKQEELYVGPLMQKGYLPDWSYVAASFVLCDKVKGEQEEIRYVPILKERRDLLKKQILNLIIEEKPDASVFSDKESLMIILSDLQERTAYMIIEKIRIRLVPYLKAAETVFAAVGNAVHGIRRLSESYMMAKKIAELSQVEHKEDISRCYSDMGINRLLFHIDSRECLEEYYKDTVRPLEEYDEINKSNLMEVLECYMKHDGSVQSTAEELYVHRNTVNYKLKKIESLLNVDLTKFSVRNELSAGIMAAKLRKCQ